MHQTLQMSKKSYNKKWITLKWDYVSSTVCNRVQFKKKVCFSLGTHYQKTRRLRLLNSIFLEEVMSSDLKGNTHLKCNISSQINPLCTSNNFSGFIPGMHLAKHVELDQKAENKNILSTHIRLTMSWGKGKQTVSRLLAFLLISFCIILQTLNQDSSPLSSALLKNT